MSKGMPNRLPVLFAVLLIVLAACSTPAPVLPTALSAVATSAPVAAPTAAATAAAAPTAAPAAATQAPAAQTEMQNLSMPREVQAAYANGFRSRDGKPGPAYFQNRSVHAITINVAPPSRTVSASEDITYTNTLAAPLSAIVLRLYLNIHKPGATLERVYPADFFTSGVQIDEFRVNGQVVPHDFATSTTYAVVKLPEPVPAKGAIRLSFTWHYDLAPANGWKEGTIDDTTFYLAYFYPRVAVLNDTNYRNWDTQEFTANGGRELANDFADYTFNVTVPKNFAVWATGDLQNPDEVLQPAYAQRLKDSLTSDQVSRIATPEEMQSGQVTAQSDTVTWRWKAENVEDIALGLSDHYQWDAGSVVVDPATQRRAGVQAAYASSAAEWKGMVDNGKAALAFGSTQWPGVPYPYSKTSIFLGGADEEYPMMANDSAEGPPGGGSRFVAAHELFHSWFPFYMGTDERRYPFMDEGWVTAFEYLFNLQDRGKPTADTIFVQFRSSNLNTAFPGADIPIIVAADATRGNVTGRNAYEKAALGFLALKDVMGEDAFKRALQAFVARWNGKHPLPWDMFNTFNDASGQNYNWFYDRWFLQPNYLDLAVGNPAKASGGYTVQVNNVGGMPVPFDVQITYTDATTETLHQTPAVWKDSPKLATIQITTTKAIQSVVLDGGIFVDYTPANNIFGTPPTAAPTTQATTEATPAPTVQATTATTPTVVGAVPPPTEALTKLRANTWRWVSFADSTQTYTIEQSTVYTATFNTDATLVITADCKQAHGSYQGEGGKLTIEIGPTTMIACPPGSRGDAFLTLLGSATHYFFDGQNLHIDLKVDGGTLVFAPAT